MVVWRGAKDIVVSRDVVKRSSFRMSDCSPVYSMSRRDQGTWNTSHCRRGTRSSAREVELEASSGPSSALLAALLIEVNTARLLAIATTKHSDRRPIANPAKE